MRRPRAVFSIMLAAACGASLAAQRRPPVSIPSTVRPIQPPAKPLASDAESADDSPRRLKDYPTYAFGYGHAFFVFFDSNIASDPLQFTWVQNQIEHLDRARFPIIVAVFHHPIYSSGPHGGKNIEPATVALRNAYMPMFRRN